MAILPQSPRIVSPSSIVTVTETFPHTVPRSLASNDANEVLTDPNNAVRLVDPLLRIGAESSDIYPVVEVDLSSHNQHDYSPLEDQEQNSSSRRRRSSSTTSKKTKRNNGIPGGDPTHKQEQQQELATEAAMKLHLSLISNFNGNDEQSKYILLTRINMVSDGSCCDDDDTCEGYPDSKSNKNKSSSARRLLLPFWSSKKSKKNNTASSDISENSLDTDDTPIPAAAAAPDGVGGARLEISYCLFVRDTGKVAFVEDKSYTKHPRNLQKQIGNRSKGQKENNDVILIEGKQLVMELTNRCARDIQKEIMACCQQHPIPRRMPSIIPPPLSSPPPPPTVRDVGKEFSC